MYTKKEQIAKVDSNLLLKTQIRNSAQIFLGSDSHFHTEVEFALVLEGCMSYLVEGEEVLVQAGECIFLDSLTEHSSQSIGFTEVCLLQFNIDLLRNISPSLMIKYFYNFLQNDFKYTIINYTNNRNHAELSELLVLISMEFDQKEVAYEFSVYSNIFRIFAILYKNNILKSYSYSINQEMIDRLTRILQYIATNYNTTITTRDTAELFHLEYGYFCHMFKKLTGHSFLEYVNSYRITIAQKMLMNENKTITDIVSEVGFESNSYFSRIFKKHTGYTPSDFRKSHFSQLKDFEKTVVS